MEDRVVALCLVMLAVSWLSILYSCVRQHSREVTREHEQLQLLSEELRVRTRLNRMLNEARTARAAASEVSGAWGDATTLCMICYDTVPANFMIELGCTHELCRICLLNLISYALQAHDDSDLGGFKARCPYCRRSITLKV
jgi:hypothetical protein